jgi:two-component sensor histidine kinase/PAS domain-containing protein/CheY-like chemotaxis protein
MVPLIAFAGAIAYSDYRQAREAAREHIQRTSRALIQAVDRNLDTYLAILDTLASNPRLVSRDLAGFHERLMPVLEILPPGSVFVVADRTGQQLLSTAQPFGSRLPYHGEAAQLARVFETARPGVSNLFVSASTGKPVISVNVPVVDNGAVIYDLAVNIPVAEFQKIFDRQVLPVDWFAAVLDRTGTLIARFPEPEKWVGRTAAPRLVQGAARAREGTVETPTLEGVMVHSTWSRSDASGWTVAVAQPLAALTAPLFRDLALLAGGALLVGLLTILYVARVARRIAGAVEAVRDNAAALGRGEDPAEPTTEFREIRDTGDSLIRAFRLLHARASELETVLDTVPVAVWIAYGANVERIARNRYGRELLRYDPAEAPTTPAPSADATPRFRFRLRGVEAAEADLPLHRAARGETSRGEEVELLFEDGGGIILLVSATPIRDADGRPVGAVAAGVDITERKRSEERQRLMLAELDHRVRNTLATVRSMLVLSDRSAATRADFLAAVEGRIDAMSRAHRLLTRSHWQGASLRALAAEELSAYAGDRLEMTGRDVVLQPDAAVGVALLIHELATNAAKHGAFSGDRGRVALDWRVDQSGEKLLLAWTESGGPPVEPPTKRGFGSVLIERALAHEFNAEVRLAFLSAGVRCDVALPLDRILAEDGGSAPAAEPAAAPPPPDSADLTGTRVLLVEDNAVIGLDMAEGLEAAGAKVIGPVASLQHALGAAAAGGFDVAVLDVNLGGEQVFPVADLLAERRVPYAFLTGYDASVMVPERLRSAPALRKPIRVDALAATVRRLADCRRPS